MLRDPAYLLRASSASTCMSGRMSDNAKTEKASAVMPALVQEAEQA